MCLLAAEIERDWLAAGQLTGGSSCVKADRATGGPALDRSEAGFIPIGALNEPFVSHEWHVHLTYCLLHSGHFREVL